VRPSSFVWAATVAHLGRRPSVSVGADQAASPHLSDTTLRTEPEPVPPGISVDALSLDDPRWSNLQHAYGSASDIPDLLRQLVALPASGGFEDEPWFSLWSSLAHQGNVHSASFAAVPHVVRALASDPTRANSTYFQFPAWVEICRQKSGASIPEDLQELYFAALGHLPALVAAAADREWDAGYLACALSAIAAAKGQGAVAEAVLELADAHVAAEFLDWFFTR